MSRLEKWNDETSTKFVGLYKKHACLWDVKSKHYKNKRVRDVALDKIEAEMAIAGFGKNEIKNKIRSLRSTYYLELKKIEQSKADADRTLTYKPTFRWFYIMQDIMARLGKNTSSQNAELNWNMDGTLQNNSSVKVKEDEDSLISEPEIKSEIVISENEFSVDEPAAKLRKTPDTASTSGMLNTSVRSNEDEECTIFGNYVGSQLKKMSSETRTLCQLNIQKLISEALLNEIHAGSTAFRIDVVNTTGAIQIKKENPDD